MKVLISFNNNTKKHTDTKFLHDSVYDNSEQAWNISAFDHTTGLFNFQALVLDILYRNKKTTTIQLKSHGNLMVITSRKPDLLFASKAFMYTDFCCMFYKLIVESK